MDKIYFITGNKNKFAEAKLIIPQLKQNLIAHEYYDKPNTSIYSEER